MTYIFNGNATHTLGVEIELQLVNAKTGALSNSIQLILDQVPAKWANSIKPEFMQSYCEFNTGICNSVKEVEEDLSEKLLWATEVADKLGLQFIWGGTHPFSRWEDQKRSPGERYEWIAENMQDVARRLVVFGLHVHVGVDTGDKAIHLCDRLYRHLPILLALSGNSPFWCGRDTGLDSYRSKVMEALPTAGFPPIMRNWSEYVWLIDNLIKTQFIHSVREIWWDVRPHAGFGTVEMRVMDMPLCMRHTLGMVALTQCLVSAISKQIDQGAYLFDMHPMIAKKNKWHAARFGMDASFVDFDTMQAVHARDLAKKIISYVSEEAEQLGCLEQLHYLDDIIENGTGAQRQRRVFEQTGDPVKVARYLQNETQPAAV